MTDLPNTIEIDQKWRALLKGSKIRKMERMTYRLNHIHAAALLHEAVKSLIFREELRARVHKFAELTRSVLHADQQVDGANDYDDDDNGGDNNNARDQEPHDQGKYIFD